MLVIDYPINAKQAEYIRSHKEKITHSAKSVGLLLDMDAGTFSGRASGTFKVTGNNIHIEATKTPMLVPDAVVKSAITSFLDGFFSEA